MNQKSFPEGKGWYGLVVVYNLSCCKILDPESNGNIFSFKVELKLLIPKDRWRIVSFETGRIEATLEGETVKRITGFTINFHITCRLPIIILDILY